MKIIIILRNALSALSTLHIRGDEAKVFAGVLTALQTVIDALDQAEKNTPNPKEEDK